MEQRRDEIIEVLHSPKISKRRPKDLQSKKTLKLVTPIAPTGFDSPQERASHKRQQAGLDQTPELLAGATVQRTLDFRMCNDMEESSFAFFFDTEPRTQFQAFSHSV